MHSVDEKIASQLLEIKAVKLQPNEPFTWASGWQSPIYCDNRKTLSHPALRSFIRDCFVHEAKERYPQAEVIAGVATGAIAQGALVAQELGLPFVYVRSKAKGHGLENLIEGQLDAGQKVVVIEDLISTGGSSLNAVKALRTAKAEVLGMLAIFTYGFPVAEENFANEKVELGTLSDYNTLTRVALAQDYISPEMTGTLAQWRENPSEWGK